MPADFPKAEQMLPGKEGKPAKLKNTQKCSIVHLMQKLFYSAVYPTTNMTNQMA